MTFNTKTKKPKEEKYTVWTRKKSQAELFREQNKDKEYNGYTNYMTWDVALNIDNEESFQEEVYANIKDGNIKNGYELKEWFKENLEESGNYNQEYDVYKLSDAWTNRELEDVNWTELYDNYKQNIKEEEEYQNKKEKD